MDKLFIRNLRVPAQVGILSHEKAEKQILSIDIVYHINAKQAALSDEILHTIDYASVRENLIHFLNDHRFNLIETLAERCADFLLTRFKMSWLQLSITKPSIFDDADGAGIIIERTSS
ncbi:dihydroneopterin aldolase [Coxiella burnetii]|uniref:dihydroneopterin aldolase n=1 Tax=Coxiella burnetii (strain RSA 493 / Nine Mile phase I) TaxID=227377 RepID=UPI0000183BD6|nr:dihydroneopterin aldolase [Coxiella burnetii]NP_820943.3 dihydroneopterin aldolase [Coxiella burnetii RSA 493]ABX77414.1 dihydroneopterin aldolase [Coxiella burnetii RSA 331]AML47998.1 diguanylate cyclase [Coxiella burnetii]AML54024.1 diguanylate cyclase [Coxiella burnetii]ARI66716.1 diguanylate cyclase [Coxiella burnetii]ARK28150.1 diguanylate cyclase [Coxiella burnetii]